MKYIILFYVAGYLINILAPQAYGFLTLEPFMIFHYGQVWRLVSWVLIPPPTGNIIFMLIMVVLYYQLGTALERTWGAFRFNVYIFGGMIFTVLGALLLYVIYGVNAALIIYSMIISSWGGRVAIIASILNFLIFFFSTRNYRSVSPKEVHRKRTYHRQVQQPKGVTRHKCAICGRTELDDPNLEFRFCSKCNGNYEYCQDHLFTHEHVK